MILSILILTKIFLKILKNASTVLPVDIVDFFRLQARVSGL